MSTQKNNFIQSISDCSISIDVKNVTFESILEQWEMREGVIEELFKKRDSEKALDLMLIGIKLYFLALFLANQRQFSKNSIIHWQEQITDFSVKPLNLEERLTYIVNNPDHYHSYFQLKQLFDMKIIST
ncbi:hypothetical protein DCC39_05915 [Pueribacillus theae]|uniref:YpoC-like domain-containing protein n=1 Tax=Pueribacillus theae TaxID=2171751 RepID=A0A2U1K484_9BACI|nr:hypothetical protein [Pueribacillus theae]PWA12337.1 hypothetical protein DCC39_05915 [Pueribacillus theae]